MPTYTVKYSGFELTPDQKDRLALSLTRTHNSVTGANTCLAQVIFDEIPPGNQYLGGKLVTEPQIYLQGLIRAGRAPEIKETLILGLRDALAAVSGLDTSLMWVYLIDLSPSQMIEYGVILPQSGRESEWFANLSPKLKEKLTAFDK